MENEEKKEENCRDVCPESAEQKGKPVSENSASEQDALKTEIEKISKERDEYLDGWRRAKADLINYKKEEFKRLEEVAKFGNEEIFKDLILVLHSFDLGMLGLEKSSLDENDQPADSLRQNFPPKTSLPKNSSEASSRGLYIIKSQMEDILKRRGLTRIKVEVGQKFDPLYNEAIGIIEKQGCESGTVAEEIEAGYMLYDKVLKPARVKVVK